MESPYTLPAYVGHSAQCADFRGFPIVAAARNRFALRLLKRCAADKRDPRFR